ncbi:MAG: LysM peptidoglycan-binding domain-containing protein [Chlorobi bacterium]|nr:LysM peptidoglycan-binding domain-containing protein [Chlorobiota bacterium]
MSRNNFIITTIAFFFLIITSELPAQTNPNIIKSEIVETIDSTTYYLHFVKDGESVFAIAKVYGVSVNDVFKHNPESRTGVHTGQVLKIPFEQKEKPRAKNETTLRKDEDFFYHIVKPHETLYGISKGYRVDIEDVKKINPGLTENLKEGQMIKIPALKKPGIGYFEEESDETKLHTIVQGETLYGIAKEYNVSIGEIKNANPGLTDVLSVGTSILIPNQIEKESANASENKSEAADSSKYHTVVAGETLFRIAKNYAVSVDTLKKHNPGLNDALYIGQKIVIPDATDSKNYIVHVTHEKEKLNKIAKKYDVSLSKIQSMNPDLKKKVSSGQQVRIPVQPRKIEQPKDNLDNDKDVIAENPCGDLQMDKEAVYNVALMIPLFLEELDSMLVKDRVDISELKDLLSFRFIQFYEGLLMAVDSMKNQGMNLNLFVYDVDNTPEKINKVLRASELGSMDLIIGPFYSTGFKQVAKFAETFNIKIVNPLTYREEIIVNQPNVFKVRPPYSTQADQLVDHILKKYPLHHILLVRHYKYKYQSEVSYIKNRLNSERKRGVFISNKSLYDAIKSCEEKGVNNVYSENTLLDKQYIKSHIDDSTWFNNTAKEILYSADSLRGLSRNISRARPNLVIALSNKRVFQYDLLSQFNKLAEDNSISLVGIPKWDELEKQEAEHLINLNFQYFSPSFIDYSDKLNQEWIQKFRDIYHTEPSEEKYAFDGFDIGWYFLNALYRYGRDFENCVPGFDIHLIQTHFDFEQNPPNGFQNTHWNLLRYDGYKVVKEKL